LASTDSAVLTAVAVLIGCGSSLSASFSLFVFHPRRFV
jgi:hypothetical protein